MCHLFFFNDTATTEIYTLSLHDALPISCNFRCIWSFKRCPVLVIPELMPIASPWNIPFEGIGQKPSLLPYSINIDRKSTRLNSSHATISYAVFCLKKKRKVPPEYFSLAR